MTKPTESTAKPKKKGYEQQMKPTEGFEFIKGYEHLYETNKKEVYRLPTPKRRTRKLIKTKKANNYEFVLITDGKRRLRFPLHDYVKPTSVPKEKPAKEKKEKKEKKAAEKKTSKQKPAQAEPKLGTHIIEQWEGEKKIAEFKTIIEAARSVSGDASSLSKATKSGKEYKNFTWKKSLLQEQGK